MTIILKKSKSVVAALVVASAIAGCSHNTLQEKNELVTNTNAYNASVNQQTSYVSKSRSIMQRPVRASFVDSTVYYAVSQVAQSLDVDFDQTFRPSSDYRITVNFEGTLGEFLHMVYIETGIKYKYRNGILSVFNKKDVDESHKIAQCKGGVSSIMVALDDVLPMEFFKFMSDKYDMSFRFDNKFYALKGAAEEGKAIKPNVSFYYKGCDKDEALREFAKTVDLKIENNGVNKYVVSDYDVAELDMSGYFNVDFQSMGGGMQGASGGSSGGQSGGGQASGSTVSIQENFREDFTSYIEKYKSRFGKVYVSNRGYVVVEDTPSVVRKIKKLIRIEKQRQAPIDLSIAIVRVDVSDSVEMGVDWNAAFNNIANSMNLHGFEVGINMADRVTNGLTISGHKGDLSSMVSALQTYGRTRIVRDFNSKTRSGIPSSFKVVDQIPYIVSSVVNNNGISEVATEARVAEAGLTISVTPTLMDHGELVDLATAITVSEYKGDKVFNVNGGEYKLPQISTNDIQMPVRVRLNDSIVLTGFKFSKTNGVNEGVPGASQVGGVLGGLFGHSEKAEQDSEFLVIITPRAIKDY